MADVYGTPWGGLNSSRLSKEDEQLAKFGLSNLIQGGAPASSPSAPLAALNPAPSTAAVGAPNPAAAAIIKKAMTKKKKAPAAPPAQYDPLADGHVAGAPDAQAPSMLPEQTPTELSAAKAQEDAANDPLDLSHYSGRPQDRGSKITKEQANALKILQAAKYMRDVVYTPEDLKNLGEGAMQIPAVAKEQKGLEDQEDLARKLMAAQAQDTTAPDFTPLADLAKMWTNGAYQSTFKPQNQDKAKSIMDYFEKIQDNKRDLAKSVLDAVKASKQGVYTTQNSTADDTTNKVIQLLFQNPQPQPKTGGNASAANLQFRKEQDIRNAVNQEQTKFQDVKNTFDTIDGALASNDYQQVSNSLAQIARFVGGEKGMLSEGDIKRVVPSNYQGSLHRFLSYFSDTPTTQMNPAYVASLRELVQRARANVGKKYKSLADSRVNGYAQSSTYKDIPVKKHFQPLYDDINALLGPGAGAADAVSPPPATPPAQGGLTPEQEKRRQELLKKASGG